MSEFIVYMLCVGASGSHSYHFVLYMFGKKRLVAVSNFDSLTCVLLLSC